MTRRSTALPIILGLSLLVLLASPTVSPAGQADSSIEQPPRDPSPSDSETPPERRVFRGLGDPTALYFVPQAVLAEVPSSDLPLRGYQRRELQAEIDRQRFIREWNREDRLEDACRLGILQDYCYCAAETSAAELSVRFDIPLVLAERHARALQREIETERARRSSRGCLPGFVNAPPDDLDSPRKLVEARTHVFIGEVIQLVQGWNFRAGEPSTMVYTQISELFQNGIAALQTGDLVAFEEGYGTVRIDGVELCTALPPDLRAAPLEPGDRVLVLAHTSGPGERLLVRPIVFPVRNQHLIPRIEGHEASWLPFPWTELERLFIGFERSGAQ